MLEFEANPSDPKRAFILERAMELVMRYGFKRMTMDDIAKATGMSRPAVYLHFKNKAEIYRAIAGDMLLQAHATAANALVESGTLQDRLYAAVCLGMLDILDFMMATPHGAELFDLKDELAGDILVEWHEKMANLFATHLDADAPLKSGLSGMERAEALMNGLEGLKCSARTADERKAGALVLVRLVA